MKGMAALTLGLVVASCNKMDFDGNTAVTPEQAKANAEAQLGVNIDPNQDWNMTQSVQGEVNMNLGIDQSYTVAICDKNPLYDDDVICYAKFSVNEGETKSFSFIAPKALNTFFVATYDSGLRSVVNSSTLNEGKLTVNVGEAATKANRAKEDASVYPQFVKTAADYLEGLTVADMRTYYKITDEIITDYTNQGNHTLTDATWEKGMNGASIGDGKHFFVPSETTITEKFHTNGAYGVTNDVVVYIEGTVHFKGNTLNGTTTVIGAGGKVIVDENTSWSNAGRFIILPGGELSGSKDLLVANGSKCYNGGTILMTSELNVNGSDFYNNGTINVDALNNQSSGIITNFGKIVARTNSGDANTYNCTIINGCYMHFTESAGVGTLTLLDNSRLDVDGQASIAGGVYSGNGAVLYDKSMINAGSIYLNGTKFTGPTGNGTYAVVKTAKMLFGQGADLAAANNVYFDWDYNTGIYNHQDAQDFNCTVDNGYTYLSYVKNQNFNYTTSEESALMIPAGECSGIGNNPNGGGGVVPSNGPVYSYAFEDTWVGDYDLNDVVLKVRQEQVTENNVVTSDKIIIKLVAAGASLDLNIRLYDYDANGEKGYGENFTLLTKNGYDEVHDMFGADKKALINTGNGVTAPAVTFELDNSNGTYSTDGVFDPAKLRIAIYSAEQDEVRLSGNGESPFGVIIPFDWKWPIERIRVTSAYNKLDAENETSGEDQSFATFASTFGSALNWFKYPTGQVYTTAVQGDF